MNKKYKKAKVVLYWINQNMRTVIFYYKTNLTMINMCNSTIAVAVNGGKYVPLHVRNIDRV